MEEDLKVKIKELLERRERLVRELNSYDSEESREPIQYNIDKITWELESLIDSIKKEIEEREESAQVSINKLEKESKEEIEALKKKQMNLITRLKRELEAYDSEEARNPIQYNIDKITWELEDNISKITSRLDLNIKGIKKEFQEYRDNALGEIEELGVDFEEFGLDKLNKNKDEEIDNQEVVSEKENKEQENVENPGFLTENLSKADKSFETIMNVAKNMPKKQEIKEQPLKESLQENIKIIVGRNAKIMVGNEIFNLESEDVIEGINLNFEEVKGIYKDNNVEIDERYWNQLESAFEKGAIDTTVINIIDRSKLSNEQKQNLLKDHIDKFVSSCNKEKYDAKSEVIYDVKDLSKTNLWKRIRKTEINTDEKNVLIENARLAERMGTAKIDGKYKPNLISRFIAKVTGRNIRMLPTIEQQYDAAEVVNEMKNREIQDFNKKAIKKEFVLNKTLLQEVEELHNDFKSNLRVNNSENSKDDNVDDIIGKSLEGIAKDVRDIKNDEGR